MGSELAVMTTNWRALMRNYGVYFVIGTAIGIAAIVSREIIELWLPLESRPAYLTSVVVVYVLATALSFAGHYRVTFSERSASVSIVPAVLRFVLVAATGMAITSVLAYTMNFHLPVSFVPDRIRGGLCFAIAAVVASVVTYFLNAKYTFSVGDRRKVRP